MIKPLLVTATTPTTATQLFGTDPGSLVSLDHDDHKNVPHKGRMTRKKNRMAGIPFLVVIDSFHETCSIIWKRYREYHDHHDGGHYNNNNNNNSNNEKETNKSNPPNDHNDRNRNMMNET
jgi:hypothetical protein